MPDLTPQQKAQLDANIRAMLGKGASQDDVISYANDFRDKYDVKKNIGGTSTSPTESKLSSKERQGVLDYMQSLKTPEELSYAKPTQKPLTQVKSSQPQRTAFDIPQEEIIKGANDKIADIMYGEDDRWQDPLKAINEGLNKSKDTKEAMIHLAAGDLAKQSLMPSGLEAKRILNDSIWGKYGSDNVTANALRQRAGEYDKSVNSLREISDVAEYGGPENMLLPLKNAAIKSYAEKNQQFKKELQTIGIDMNDPDLAGKIPSGKMGAIMNEFLNDRDIHEFVEKENPKFAPAMRYAQETLLTDNPQYGINVIANKVSQAVQKSGYNSIEPIFNFNNENSKEVANQTAKEVLTPKELEIYNNHIRDHQEDYLDKPSFFERFAGAGKEFGKGLLNTVTEPFTPVSKTIKEGWIKDAENVSANPEGLVKYIGDVGHAVGLVSSIVATGNLTGIANQNTAATVATSLGFFGDELEHGKIKYPDNPVKAWASAAVNTSLYAALSMDLFPVGKAKAAFEEVRPEVANVIENLTSGKISKEAARQEINTLGKQAIDFASGTLSKGAKISAELTGITAINRGLDKVMGMDEQQFQQLHPEDEIAKTLSSSLAFLPIAGVAKYGEMKAGNKIVEQSLYEAASNPKMYERVIDELGVKDPSVNVDDLKSNLHFLNGVLEDLNQRGVDPAKQKRYLYEAMREKVATETKPTETSLAKKHDEEIKSAQEVKDKILNGEDVSEKPEIPKQEPKVAEPIHETDKTKEQIQNLEQERTSKIDESHKPDVKMEFIPAKELVDSKDPLKFRGEHYTIKDKFKQLRQILDCIWA